MNMNQSESATLNIRRLLVTGTAAALVGLAAISCNAAPTEQFSAPSAASTTSQSNQSEQLPGLPSDPWQADQLMKPEELIKSLSGPTDEKPLVLQVGFLVLYQGGHIVGSKFAGPATKPQGVQRLKSEVEKLSRDKPIVLYCGCCPWTHCPNIRPAFRILQEMGFKNVRILELPNNLQQDWIAKGFPVEKGGEAK
jgi:rhodanese-related sulfurtransferase